MSRRSTQDWALRYAALGWRVFPVIRGGKRPCYKGWQRDATTDPLLIERYWRREPTPNIGIVTGRTIVAFDIEAAHLAAFHSWLAAEGHSLPDTPTARTGRGGIHILARASDPIRGRTLRLGGVHIGELKAMGGFIVACPSVTEGQYGWIRSPGEVELEDAPGWLVGLAAQASRQPAPPVTPSALGPSRAVAMTSGLYRVVASASEGERNRLLYWAACRVTEHGLDPVAAKEILLAAAKSAGLSEREARSTIESGLAR